MKLDLPDLNIAEITLLGTGGGYGESIVLHIGNSNWIVIDSCINPNTKQSLPLLYLKTIGVNVSTNVKLIICTHWHDDHILGISQLLEECNNSTFCMAKPNDLKKFLRMVKLDYTKSDVQVSNSSTIEFNKCIQIIEQRNPSLKIAVADKILLKINLSNDVHSEIISLSPSDYTLALFDLEIASLITEFGASSKKIIVQTPNAKSVALYLKLGSHRAILGADLEVSKNNDEGWLNILDKSQVIDKESSLFKIPHHGSSNGYCNRVWDKLLSANSVSKLTPWNKNRKLPDAQMLNKFISHTEQLYMTSPLINSNSKKRDRSIEKTIKNMNLKIKEVKYSLGMIRNRIDIQNANDKWQTDLHENAFHVNKI